MSTTPERLLTTAEAAEYLGLAQNTLRVRRVTGINTPIFCRLGRSVRYRLSDLEAFVATRTFTSTSQAA
ncbi:MAG: hypothetical protein ABS76_14420 [Pelagibacterium sp. SCN 64-44]|nr:MAG: hypothetical protein ABS76_14420 [Pelagibacterium sp. SCN 64-44]